MATPKNLKRSLAKKTQEASNRSFSETFKNWKDGDNYSELNSLLKQLVQDLARAYIGVSHSSNIVDNWTEDEMKNFVKQDYDTSSDLWDEDDSSKPDFDRYEFYETEIKDKFRQKITNGIESVSFLDMDSFKNIFNELAKKHGFKGSEADLEKMLKNSSHFREFAQNQSTRYTG